MTLKLPRAPYNTAKAIYAGRTMLRFFRTATFTGVTASVEGVFTMTSHGFEVGNTLVFRSGTGGSGLTAGDMYYVIAVPSDSTFKLSASYGGEAVTIATAYTAMVFSKAHCIGLKEVTKKGEIEVENVEEPGDDGKLYVVDTRDKSQKESMEFEMPESLRLLELFDGQLFGSLHGTATVFTPDPQRQAAGTIALVSEENFPARLGSNGEVKEGGGFSKGPLVLQSLKPGGIKYTTAAQVVSA